jgi:hypothetical protein
MTTLRQAIVASVVLASCLVLIIVFSRRPIPDHAMHILITLVAISIVHLLDLFVFKGEMMRLVKKVIEDTSNRVLDKTQARLKEMMAEESESFLEKTHESLRKHFALLGNADKIGLVAIYKNREEALDDVIDSLKKAEKKVWILGVALTLAFELRADILETLCQKMKNVKGFDLRILLLDALRSPAVFRTFLESSGEDVEAILQTDPEAPDKEQPYFLQTLYTDYNSTYKRLSALSKKILWPCIRYYAHSPSFWMIVTDEEIFLEPYTYGRPPGRDKEGRIGGGLPVFRFRNLPEKGTYEILCDHYDKLWLTSDIDLFQVEARRFDRACVLKRILDRGWAWLRNAQAVLHPAANKKPNEDRRRYPRYVFAPRFKIPIRLNGGTEVEAEVVDISRTSIRLALTEGEPPKPGQKVGRGDIEQPLCEDVYLVRRLWEKDAKLVCKRVDDTGFVLVDPRDVTTEPASSTS